MLGYLDSLAEEAERKGRRVVVVLDNASFHEAKAVQGGRPRWGARGSRLYYLPAYCPHLNLIRGSVAQAEGLPHASGASTTRSGS